MLFSFDISRDIHLNARIQRMHIRAIHFEKWIAMRITTETGLKMWYDEWSTDVTCSCASLKSHAPNVKKYIDIARISKGRVEFNFIGHLPGADLEPAWADKACSDRC